MYIIEFLQDYILTYNLIKMESTKSEVSVQYEINDRQTLLGPVKDLSDFKSYIHENYNIPSDSFYVTWFDSDSME